MEISKDVYLKVFQNNFNYEIVDTALGTAVKMPCFDAFIYNCVTGAGYLENPIYPFTPKGLLKLFYNAFDYKFVTGIFDNTTLKNTPFILSLAKKYLFQEDKYIVPFEFVYESELTDYLQSKYSSVDKPENYIIQRIEARKGGKGMEPFLEYIAAEYFKNNGYIVENQIPLAHSVGSPDFGAYGLENIINSLSSHGFLPGIGFHIIELAMVRLYHRFGTKNIFSHNNLIVGEAKSNTTSMSKQLEKYLNTGLFDVGFEIHPSKAKPGADYFGLVTLDSSYKITVIPPNSKYIPQKILSKPKYIAWLTNYMKFYLLANFTNDELNQFYFETKGRHISSQSDIVDFVTSMDMDTILNKVKVLCNGIVE
jgi:hypothetical protein